MWVTRVLVAEDHLLVRQGLRMVLALQPDFVVLGEAGDGDGVLAALETLSPDLLLLDLDLPGRDGLELLVHLNQVRPLLKVLALTGNADADLARRALASGAWGFVLKHDGSELILRGARAVMQGTRFVCPRMVDLMENAAPRRRLLTPREQELLGLIAQGMDNLGMAEALHLSLHTVRTHRQNLMAKLGVRNAAEVTAYAIRVGYARPLPASSQGGEAGEGARGE